MKCIVFAPSIVQGLYSADFFKEFEIPHIEIEMAFFAGNNVFKRINKLVWNSKSNIMAVGLGVTIVRHDEWELFLCNLGNDGWRDCATLDNLPFSSSVVNYLTRD